MVDFVDIHSHTLPGVDDGSPSFEVSLAMLEVALGQGVGTMVLTPHLRPIDGPDQEQEHRERFAELQAAVRDAGLEIELHLGSEIAFRFNMPEVDAHDLEKRPLSLLVAARERVLQLCGETEVDRLFSRNPACVLSGKEVLRGESLRAAKGQKLVFSNACWGVERTAERPVMAEQTATINNPLGIHARPAALLVQAAAQFTAEIYLSKGEVEGVNGKSIMGVMMLAAEQGAQVTVRAEGEDAEAAVAALIALLESNFEDPS